MQRNNPADLLSRPNPSRLQPRPAFQAAAREGQGAWLWALLVAGPTPRTPPAAACLPSAVFEALEGDTVFSPGPGVAAVKYYAARRSAFEALRRAQGVT